VGGLTSISWTGKRVGMWLVVKFCIGLFSKGVWLDGACVQYCSNNRHVKELVGQSGRKWNHCEKRDWLMQ